MYGLLVGLVLVVAVPRSALFFFAAVRASTNIHDVSALRVMRAPLAFFHTNPVGRMLNRCGGVAESELTGALSSGMQIWHQNG